MSSLSLSQHCVSLSVLVGGVGGADGGRGQEGGAFVHQTSMAWSAATDNAIKTMDMIHGSSFEGVQLNPTDSESVVVDSRRAGRYIFQCLVLRRHGEALSDLLTVKKYDGSCYSGHRCDALTAV